MKKNNLKTDVAKLKRRVSKLERANLPRQQKQTPSEIEQEKFQKAIESFNRDEDGLSLNSHPDAKVEDL